MNDWGEILGRFLTDNPDLTAEQRQRLMDHARTVQKEHEQCATTSTARSDSPRR